MTLTKRDGNLILIYSSVVSKRETVSSRLKACIVLAIFSKKNNPRSLHGQNHGFGSVNDHSTSVAVRWLRSSCMLLFKWIKPLFVGWFQMYRLTIRASKDDIARQLCDLLETQFWGFLLFDQSACFSTTVMGCTSLNAAVEPRTMHCECSVLRTSLSTCRTSGVDEIF